MPNEAVLRSLGSHGAPGIPWAPLWLALAVGCSGSSGGNGAPGARNRGSDASAPADPCPHGKLGGSYAIMTDEDVSAIAGCSEITGDLTVSGDTVTTLSLPKLSAIGGALELTNATALTSFELSSLATIAKDLTVDTNPVLSTFDVQILDSVETLLITNNPNLKDFDLSALTKARFLGLQGDALLATFELPQLESVGVFVISMNAALTDVRLSSLTIIEGDGFMIAKNPVLATLEMPLLKTLIGDISIHDNPMLPSCQIDALVAQIEGAPVPVGAFGNDDSATCP